MTDFGPSGAYGSGGYGSFGASDQKSLELIQLQQLSLNTRILTEVNPWMGSRPDVIMELASSGLPPDQLAMNGAAMFGMQNIDGLRTNLEGLPGPAQRSLYSRLTVTQQRALQHMGYAPPDDGGGFWNNFGPAGELVGQATGFAWSPVSKVAGPTVGGALDLLTWIGDQPAHLYRTIRTMDDWNQILALGIGAAAIALAIPTMGGSLAAGAGALGTLGTLTAIGMTGLGAATATAAITDPMEWWDAYQNTWDGEKVFERGAQAQARALLGGDELMVQARNIAAELDPYELATELAGERGGGQDVLIKAVERVAGNLADPGTDEYMQVFGGLMALVSEEPFMEAVNTLQQGKISFGRDIADVAGFDKSSPWYPLTSGMIDGLWLVTMDPLMGLSVVGKANRVRRAGAGVSGGAEFLARLRTMMDGPLREQFTTIANSVEAGDWTLLNRPWRTMWTPMQEWRRKSIEAGTIDTFGIDELYQFFDSADGMTQILSGKGTVRGVAHAVLATGHEGAGWSRFVRELRQFRNAIDDVALENEAYKIADREGVRLGLEELLPSNVLDQQLGVSLNMPPGIGAGGRTVVEREAGQIGQALGEAIAGRRPVVTTITGTGGERMIVAERGMPTPGVRTVGSLLASITSMSRGKKAIRVVGEGADEDIPQLIEELGRAANMPSWLRDEWLNTIMYQGAANQRRLVLHSFQDTILRLAGMRSNTEVSQLADKYLHMWGQGYGLGGLDRVVINGVERVTGVLPATDQATHIVLPDLKEMTAAIRRGHILKHVARVTDSNFVEQSLTRVWKPSVLLRIGFIPRAAGEEQLAWWARGLSEGALGQEFGARNVAQFHEYQRAVAKRAALKPGEGLDLADQAALRWRIPTHLRPLERMFTRIGWMGPEEMFLDNYSRWLTTKIERGAGYKIPEIEVTRFGPAVTVPERVPLIGGRTLQASRSPQWHHGLLYGRQNSWRRMAANGVDSELIEAADAWVLGHADAVMAATSAMNAGPFEKSIVNPDIQMINVPKPGTGELVQEPFLTLRGERERVGQGDWRWAASMHHRPATNFDDDVIGAGAAQSVSRYWPEQGFRDFNPPEAHEILAASRGVTDFQAQALLLRSLQPRADQWAARADNLRDSDPVLSSIIDQLLAAGEEHLLPGIVAELRRVAAGGDFRLRHYTVTELERARYGLMADQLEPMLPHVERIAQLGHSPRNLISIWLSADIANEQRYFNLDALHRWAYGEELVSARPKNPLYRGVKDLSTIEVRPNGDLVLLPQQNNDWNGMVISMSRIADQSLGYAVSPGAFNSSSSWGLGALIEVDGDEVLRPFGRTWAEIDADPISYSDAAGTNRIGPQLIGHGIDDNELALVLSREGSGHYDVQAIVDELGGVMPYGAFARDIEYRLGQIAHGGLHNVDLRNELAHWGNFMVPDPQANPMERVWQHLAGMWLQRPAGSDDVFFIREEARRLHGLITTHGRQHLADEVVVPAGKWRIQSGDEMEEIVSEIQRGLVDTRWPWLTNVAFRDAQGRSVERILQDFVAELEGFRTRGATPIGITDITGDFPNITDPLQIKMLQSTIMRISNTVENSPFNMPVEELRDWLAYTDSSGLEPLTLAVFTELDKIFQASGPADALAKLRSWNGGLPGTLYDATELAEYLKALDPDAQKVIAGALGIRLEDYTPGVGWEITDASLEKAAGIILANEDVSRPIAEAMSVRGTGGFDLFQSWTPVHTTWDDFVNASREEMLRQLHRPENAEYVRQSDYALQTDAGIPVALPMQEGLRRIYVPNNAGSAWHSMFQQQLARFEGDREGAIRGMAQEMLADSRALRIHTDFINRLDPKVREQIIVDAIRSALDPANGNAQMTAGQVVHVPFNGLAYDDPYIAQWVSDVLSGYPPSGTAKGFNYLDVPRTTTPDHGPYQQYGGEAGGAWWYRNILQHNVKRIDGQGVVYLPGGVNAAGASFHTALRDFSDVINQKFLQDATTRTKERMRMLVTPDGHTGLYRRRNRELVEVPGDSVIAGKEAFYLLDGTPVEYGDARFMRPETTEGGQELLWPLIGPMVRDHWEGRAGFIDRVPSNTRMNLGPYDPGEPVATAEQWVPMLNSRIDDVYKTAGEFDLPNVTLVEKHQAPYDRWFDKAVRWGFDSVIGPSLDGLVRKPMSFHYFAAARRQNKKFLEWLIDKNVVETDILRRFENELSILEGLTTLDASTIQAAQLVANQHYGMQLDDAEDVSRWLIGLGVDNDEFVGEMQKVFDVGARTNDPALRLAAELLMQTDTNPLRLVGTAADGTPAVRLVRAYHKLVPQEVWAKGQDAVNAWIVNNKLGLPLLDDGFKYTAMNTAARQYGHAINTVNETAKLRAMENVVPFLDSHEQRTQFAVIARNMLPFWYAEENFLRRWTRTFAIGGTLGMAELRKMQLLYNGVRSIGMIRTDANGKDWFVYPGSSLLAEALTRLPFMPDALPVGVLFQADVQQMLPGLNERVGTPGVSPFVAMPLDVVTRLFPDATPVKRALLGDIGSSRSALDQFVPTTVRNVWNAAFADEDSNRRYASAMMAAAAMMEANGQGLPDYATPDQVDEYMDKLRNHARVVMWAQAITGFVVPGAPIAINTGEENPDITDLDLGSFGWWTGLGVESPDEVLSARYRQYIQNMGVDEGTAAFLAEFPNADLEDVVNPLAYTVPTSVSISGAPLPATKIGLQWYNQHKSWIDSMPEAGAWFLPPDQEDKNFDYYSYQQQLVNGLRKQRDPTDFVRAVKYRQGAGTYFEAREALEQAKIAVGDDDNRSRMLDAAWETWRDTWLAAHPIFAEELVSGEARQRRQRTIDQLRYAVNDPAHPETPHFDAIKEMTTAFDAYTVALMQLNESRSADNVRRAEMLRDAFEQYATAWRLNHPLLEQMWSSVFKPEASL